MKLLSGTAWMSLTDGLFMAKLHFNILRLIVSTHSCLTSVMNFTTRSCCLHRQNDLWHISLSALESQASVKRTICAVRENLRQNKSCVWVSQVSWNHCGSSERHAVLAGPSVAVGNRESVFFLFSWDAWYYISAKPESFVQGHFAFAKHFKL